MKNNINMSASTLLLSFLLLSGSVSCWTEYRRNISAESGQTVNLPCQHPDNFTVDMVKWSRTDLGDEYVLLYRDEQIEKSFQNPSFWDRVDLQDRRKEDGDVSLVLEDTRTYDTGTYQCRVVQRGVAEGKEETPVCTIHLDVAPPPPPLPEDKDEDGEDRVSEDEDYENEDNLDEKNKVEKNLEEKNRDEETEDDVKDGSMVYLPVSLVLVFSVAAFLVFRGRCFRPQILTKMMLKKKFLL